MLSAFQPLGVASSSRWSCWLCAWSFGWTVMVFECEMEAQGYRDRDGGAESAKAMLRAAAVILPRSRGCGIRTPLDRGMPLLRCFVGE